MPPGHGWFIIDSCDVRSQFCTYVTFDEAVGAGHEPFLFSFGNWLGGNLDVGEQAGWVGVRLGKLAVEPNWVVSRELRKLSVDRFVNLRSDRAGGTLAGHDSLLNTTGEVTIRVAVTFVDDTLECGPLPTHIEITMVHRTSGVTIREDERLVGIFGLAKFAAETGSVVIHLIEDTGEVDRKSRRAASAVRSPGAIRDMRLVVVRIKVLSVPAALEVELGTDTIGARPLWKEVRLGAAAAKVQTHEGNRLLLETTHRRSLGGVPRDHAEVVWENGGLSGLVGEEVVGDWATRDELKRVVCILEVQLGKPIRGLVFLNAGGSALGLPKIIRRRDRNPEVGTTNDSVNVTSDRVGAHDRVSTFSDKNVLAHKKISICGHCKGKQNERGERYHRHDGKRGVGNESV